MNRLVLLLFAVTVMLVVEVSMENIFKVLCKSTMTDIVSIHDMLHLFRTNPST